MRQFGLNMNFLGIKQVLTIIFTLKITFYFLFLDFLIPWTARII
jgi:sterol desaturase/sphingolipid hydroxylase (fatty acid hydroxylase superfamily)